VKIIKVARDFSSEPAGRYRSDGPNSGERFRDNYLVTALREEAEKVVVDLNDLEGYGSSFLEESFGGLVRLGYFTKEQLHAKMELRASDQALVLEIWSYVDDADVAVVR
jgi:hypothetical protein